MRGSYQSRAEDMSAQTAKSEPALRGGSACARRPSDQNGAGSLSTKAPRLREGLMALGIDLTRGGLDPVSKRHRRMKARWCQGRRRNAGRKNRLPRLFGVTACICFDSVPGMPRSAERG